MRREKLLGAAVATSVILISVVSAKATERQTTASDKAENDIFGYSVKVSGDLLIVGAPGDDDEGSNAGAAYVYRWNGSNWVDEFKLSQSVQAAGDECGRSVDIADVSSTQKYAIVGCPFADLPGKDSAGRVLFFKYKWGTANTWESHGSSTSANPQAGAIFGTSVAVDAGPAALFAVALVGAPYENGTYNNEGTVYYYELLQKETTFYWERQASIKKGGTPAANDNFGVSVAAHEDYFIVGCPGEDSGRGSAHIWVWLSGPQAWFNTASIYAEDDDPGDWFGYSVDIVTTTVGYDYAVVGALGDDESDSEAGAAYVFNNSDGWVQVEKLNELISGYSLKEDDGFGFSVGISEELRVIVGAYGDDDEGSLAGIAYTFYEDDGWEFDTARTASDAGAGDLFGWGVAISDDYDVAGAPGWDASGPTINGCGAVYTYY